MNNLFGSVVKSPLAWTCVVISLLLFYDVINSAVFIILSIIALVLFTLSLRQKNVEIKESDNT